MYNSSDDNQEKIAQAEVRSQTPKTPIQIDTMRLTNGIVAPCVALVVTCMTCLIATAVNLKEYDAESIETVSDFTENDTLLGFLNTTYVEMEPTFCSFYAAEFFDDSIKFADNLFVSDVLDTELSPRAVAYDRMQNILFWSDFKNPDVMLHSVQLRQQGRITSVVTVNNNIDDIALDTYRKLILLSVMDQGIMWIQYDGEVRKWVVTEPIFLCLGIALDISAVQLYYADSLNYQIHQCNYSIDNDCTLFELYPGPDPYGLALDVQAQVLYWILRETAEIRRKHIADNTTEVYLQGANQIVNARSLVFCQGNLFYASFLSSGAIYKVEQNQRRQITSHTLKSPADIAVA